jgi:tellurite resistance protein TerC
MGVHSWVWGVSLVVLVGILLFDLLVIGRRPHEPSLGESLRWVGFYVGLAVLFGLGLWSITGSTYAAQFYAGWLTEYSLSVDNLFVFVIIMSRFAVPRQFQQKTLMIGIVIALVMRGVFITLGAALINRFDWVFFIFGAFLFYAAAKLASHGTDDPGDYKENFLIKVARRWLHGSSEYDEKAHFFTRQSDGRRRLSPLIVVVIAIGTTDLVFALDSIPAIFGLTTEAYIVFAANVFALMGLRQLYFLLGDLLNRLKFLSYGLSVVLAFIGVKLILEALAGNNLSFVNNGQPFSWAPEVPIWLSLVVIGATLAVTTVASLVSTRHDNQQVTAGAATGAAQSGPSRPRPRRGEGGTAASRAGAQRPTDRTQH